MKSADRAGSCNAVAVAATTSLSSSLSTSLLNVANTTTSSSSSSSSLSSSSSALRAAEQDPGLACCWQGRGGSGGPGGLRDLHSSSDTDDCDLDLGVGRLVIDLEADPDARTSRCPVVEMKSSSGGVQPQKSIGGGHSSSTGLHCVTAPLAGGANAMELNPHLARSTKVAPPSSEVTTKPSSSHKPVTKAIGPSTNTSFLPMSTALGDLADKGIKMRIKCNQSGPNSSSSGSTMKHEILPYHSPFIPSSSENTLGTGADNLSLSATKISNERCLFGSGGLGSRSNCNRSSSHRKDRHSTKDRSKSGGLGRTFGEDLVLTSAARASPSSTPVGCSSSSAKEFLVDVAVKMDVALSNSESGKALTSLLDDPYEFNMKTEEMVGLPVKKIKLEKCDAASSPFADHSQQDLEQKDAEVDACHIGVITEPECLGPCEPGTSVTLEGIVWNETENGLLVVNVTWRGKTYVGTLMDSTKHHWAPPRFSGDSPTSDFETRTPKGRGKRGRTCAVAQRNEGNGSDRKLRSNRSSKPSTAPTVPSPVRNDSNSLKRSRTETASSDGSRGSKCSRSDSRTSDLGNGTGTVGAYGELTNGGLIECPEENCSKKYRNLNGLRYHQTRVHKTTCPSLAKEMQDVQTNKYASDDFVENSAAAVDRFVWRAKPSSAEASQSKRTGLKPMENETKVPEALEELVESQTGSIVNGSAAADEGSKERDAGPVKVSSDVEPKLEQSPEPVSINAVDEELTEQSKGATTLVAAACKGANSYVSITTDDSRKLGAYNQPLVTLTPAFLPARTSEDNTDSTAFQLSTASAGSLGVVATGTLVVPPGAPSPSGDTNTEDVKSQSSSDQSKSDADRGKKSKSDKSDRSKVRPPSGCIPRPVVPPTSGAVAKPVLLSSCPPTTSQAVPAQQPKSIQPKPVLSSEHVNMSLAMLADKSKKRRREKERSKELPLLPGMMKPLNRPAAGSETTSEAAHLLCQNAAVPLPSTSPQVDYAESGIGQASVPASVAVSSSSGISDGFGQLQLSTGESGHVVGHPDLVPVMARCSPALGTMPQFPVHPAAKEQPVSSQPAPATRPSDSSSSAVQSSIQMALPPSSPVHQQRLLLPVENMTQRPIVVGLQSPLSALKAVPSSVIKNTSGFEIGSNCDLLSESKPQPAPDADLPSQPQLADRKQPALPTSSDFVAKPSESGGKATHEGHHPTSGTNPPLTSPSKKSKVASAKHVDGGSGLADFGSPHSPAYSDISDANDNAPMLDAPMLEKEAQAAAEEEETIGSKVSPSHAQDSYVYSPFYGQPPYLTPAVSSSDIPDCGSALKSSLSSKPPSSDKHPALDKVKSESAGAEKRLVSDPVPARSRPSAEMSMKFPNDHHQLREQQPLRDDKDSREKGGSRAIPAPSPVRTDVHKIQQQQQHPQHKMFSAEAMLPQQAAVMHHMMMPSSYGFGAQFGYYPQEYSNEMQRIFQLQQQQQQQEARRHEQTNVSKSQSDGSGDHGNKSRQTGKVPADGKPLPTPPSLIPDRNRHDLKDEVDRGREKQLENRKLTKDVIEVKSHGDVVGTKPDGSYDMKALSDRNELQRYCIQSHFLEQQQQQQQRLSEHQSHKSKMESGGGGCKPSAVVAPQARDKNSSGIVGNAPMLHGGSKQSSREDTQGRGHEGHRSHRDSSQKNPSMTSPQQQHAMQQQQHKSGAGSASRDGSSSGRVQKDAAERGNAKEDSGPPSGSRGVIAKGKDEVPMTSLPVSLPTGIPAPYAPYYGHYLPPTPYGSALPFDPTHAPMYPGMMGYAPAPYIHPQMLSPALAMASADVKPCDILAPTQPPPSFFSNEGQTHKIHELKEVAKMQQGADGSQPSPGSRDPSRPKSGSGSHLSGKDTEHSSPPTQRHVHTHHHMHVVGLPYRFVSSDAAIIASQQAAAATDATQIPRPFLK